MEWNMEEGRPKIEVVRVSSIERRNFRPLDGVQLHAAYSHVRVGTYGSRPEPEIALLPPIELNQPRKDKKNLGPVSRLLRRRQQATTHLATKSCDNIYSVNKNSSSFNWKIGNRRSDQRDFQVRQSKSLDWRADATTDDSAERYSSRSAEHLSRNLPLGSGPTSASNTKSKIVALLKRLSPRLTRPIASKRSLPSSPSAIYPWIQVEYSEGDVVESAKNEDSRENDVGFRKELHLNQIRKQMIKSSSAQQVPSNAKLETGPSDNKLPSHLTPPKPSSAHKEEEGEDKKRRSHGKAGRRAEVAGLESSCENGGRAAVTPVLQVGVVPDRAARRTKRPLSLAVQPLNLGQRSGSAKDESKSVKHFNMTSQESIGSCSLDIEQSASDLSAETTVGSLSERTLHSLNLSCNGEERAEDKRNGSNGCRHEEVGNEAEPEQLITKIPSYLGLACSISGYSGITRYDSKLREGFRSRDSSPGARLITRDTSPAAFRSNEEVTVRPTKSQSISPLAMERQNGFTNGTKESRRVGRSFLDTSQGYSEVDRGASPWQNSNLSDVNSNENNNARKSGVTSPQASNNAQSFSNSTFNASSTFETNSFLDSSVEIIAEVINGTKTTYRSNRKSDIQQRAERLYGPGALAQGFFKRSSNSKLNVSGDSSFSKSSNSNVSSASLEDSNTDDSFSSLPVLRNLRPEFRAQLPVAHTRRPTDGSEQLIKPLQRVSMNSKKPEETKEVPALPKVIKIAVAEQEPIRVRSRAGADSSSSDTSLGDQQLASPKVVLPVKNRESNLSGSLNVSVKQQATEVEPVRDEDKDGHYFVKLLERERGKLLSLAAEADAELEAGAATLPEEAAGKLRSASGKARLLASQKMDQFMGLCKKNMNDVAGDEFPTTNGDLAGFWDMVMLQVVDVKELFKQLDQLRRCQWQEVTAPVAKKSASNQNNLTKRRIPAPKAMPAMNSEANRKAREAREQSRRQMLEERRRAMRSGAKNGADSVEIFAPET